MTEKNVYNPKKDAQNPTKSDKKKVADSKDQVENDFHVEAEDNVTEFKAKVNKYGFLHIPKRTWTSLPFGLEKPLAARINGNSLVIGAAMEKSS